MSKVCLVAGCGSVGNAIAAALIEEMECEIVPCEIGRTVELMSYGLHSSTRELDYVLPEMQHHGKRGKKGKVKKDWHRR